MEAKLDAVLAEVASIEGFAGLEARTFQVAQEVARVAKVAEGLATAEAQSLAAQEVETLIQAGLARMQERDQILISGISDAVEHRLAKHLPEELPSVGTLRDVIRTEVSRELEEGLEGVQALAAGRPAVTGPSRPRPAVATLDPVGSDGLTQAERAYKEAFETGRTLKLPERDGQPALRIDPAVAREHGVTGWRDWYLLEDYARRMRMARGGSVAGATWGDPSVVVLPPVDAGDPDAGPAVAQ